MSVESQIIFLCLQRLAAHFYDLNGNNNNVAMTSSDRRHSSSTISQHSSLADDISASLSLRGKTYIIKSCDNDQVIAFNGSKTYIISRSQTMYVIVLTDKKAKRDSASSWLRGVASSFKDKGF